MIGAAIPADILLFLVIGVLGGSHCIGMCGPLVATYANRMRPDPDGRATAERQRLTPYEVRQHALFNAGRATSYAVLGALFGAIGGAVLLTAEGAFAAVDTVRGVLGVGVGAVVVAVGVRCSVGGAVADVRLPGVSRATELLIVHVDRFVNGPGIVALGALHGLLPCPILYPAYLFAFASGSPLAGGLALGALGTGTIPAVFLYGALVGSVGVANRRRVHRLLGVAFVALGYVLLAHGLMALGIHLPHPELPRYQPVGGGH